MEITSIKKELHRMCRIAFEGFNDGGTKCYTDEYYTKVFRPKWFNDNVKPEYKYLEKQD